MSGDGTSPAGGGAFDPRSLEGLGGDDWARVLPLLRAALHDLDDDRAGPAIRRLRAAPTGRLASGRTRSELCALVRDDPRVREAVAARIEAAELPGPVRAALAGRVAPDGPDSSPPGPAAGEVAGLRAQVRDVTRRAERAAARLREVREERDRLLRRVEGAESRAVAAQSEAELERRQVAQLRAELDRLTAQLAQAADERRRALDREQRRTRTETEDLREEVRRLRRRDQEREAQLDRLRTERSTAARPPGATPAELWPERVEAARPTALPETVARGTAEEADLLLTRGRLVVVDGYNLTLQHRPQLDLAGQREWLVRRLATLAAQRRVRPVVVFDGQRASAARPVAGAREVEVRFTPAGLTADDELLFLVEALDVDEPVLAVTDDRELRARLVARGVDVVGTGPFVWATPG